MQAIEFLHPLERNCLDDSGYCLDYSDRLRLEAVVRGMRSARGVDEVFGELVERLVREVPFDRLGLALLSSDGNRAVSHRVYSTRPVLIWGPGQSRPLLGSSLEALLREDAVRIIHDLRLYQQLRPSSLATKRLIEEGMRSSLTIPLFDGGKPLGFLFFTSCDPDAYTPRHALMAGALAPSIGRAFGHALSAEPLVV